MGETTVVINDCAAPAARNPKQIRFRDTEYAERNFQFSINHLAAGLPAQLNDAQLDWAMLLASIYAADRACVRGNGDTDWNRDISLHIPMRDPEHWEPFLPELQEVFSSLTYDRLRIHLYEDEAPETAPRQRREGFSEAIDCVALVSGGMDSFVGGAKLLDDGRRPLLVSHTASGAANSSQVKVTQALVDGGGSERVTFMARPNAKFPGTEDSQRSRTMLYIGLAAMTATALGLEDVFLNENGIMAIHLPMTAARVGSLSTRTAAPAVVERMSRLCSEALGQRVEVRNELVKLTKPEVVGLACSLGVQATIKETVSCWAISRTSTHCGTCAPCLMRRISCDTHGVQDAPYATDIFGDDRALAKFGAKANLVHMLQFIGDLRGMDDFQLLMTYFELANGSSAIDPIEIREMYRRWGNEAHAVLSAHPVPMRFM